MVLLEPLDHPVRMVRLVNRDPEVNKAIQETLEQLDHQEDLVSKEFREIEDSTEVLVLLVHQALLVLSVYRV